MENISSWLFPAALSSMGCAMAFSSQQKIRLFRVFGITVFLHWSWFLVAAWEMDQHSGRYDGLGWNIAEYMALFAMVLIHEFGHALACRSVGGRADEIVLWPLGGVAFVSPPPRPGAVLWTIAAGPLVNVAILAGFSAAHPFLAQMAMSRSAWNLVVQIQRMNLGLLIFNLLPIYPLDGGQILRALLWFPFGPARSLMAVVVIGVLGAVGFIGLALWIQSSEFIWIGVIAVFILSQCWAGYREAKRLGELSL